MEYGVFRMETQDGKIMLRKLGREGGREEGWRSGGVLAY